MKKLFFIFIVLICASSMAQKSIPKPNPARLVVDNANVLSSFDREALERKLVTLDDSTSNQIVVLTVQSLNGEIPEDVATKTFREWGIGNKKTSNGILILVAIADRKIRIEVGYGLEGAIPDVTAKQIIENDLKPAFKQQNYYGGINRAVDDLSKAAAGEYHVARHKSSDSGSGGGSLIKFIIIVIFVIIFLIISKRGGGRGGGGGGLGFIAPLLFNTGGWSGGGSSGDSGGGFGGFGGGSSGGGGAGGDW